MEVTNVADKVTHAIIGRGNVESFGMSEDAELYHILSSALYSRKKEACVREVLCNAWDSHVDSGITQTPVKITLTSDRLSIQDFGAGLDPLQIKPIYGTYGKSTKQHDGRQTGGFGLGSKAPFAYVDHFEVISCHQGIKTIYKMSQSNAEIGGKPSISTIVSVPTEESGMTVSVNLKESDDRHEFEQIIRRLVEMGDMNVTLNGYPLDTIPFEKATHGFMLVSADRFQRTSRGSHKHPIYIRYGHVVYPLNADERFSSQYEAVEKFLETISPTNYYRSDRRDWVLVLQADPHTISVVPSREDLSMTDKTVNTVTDLLTAFLAHSRGRLESTCTEMFTDAVEKVWLVDKPATLFETEKKVPLIEKVEELEDNFLFEFDTLSRHYLKQSYPKFTNFRKTDLDIKLKALAQSGFGNRGLIQSFRQDLLRVGSTERPSGWFQRRLVNLAIRGIATTKAIDVDRLYVYTQIQKGRYESNKGPGFVPAAKWVAPTIERCLPFLRNIIILTHARSEAMMDRLHSFPILKFWLGSPLNNLCYAAPRHPEKTKKAREHFEKLGFTVIDLTKVQPWEEEEVIAPVQRAAPRPRKKGIPCLTAGLVKDKATNKIVGFHTEGLRAENAARIEKPEFIIRISSQSNTQNHFPYTNGMRMNSAVSLAVVRQYGRFGGVVQNSTQQAKFEDMGAEEMRPWLAKKLLEEYKTNAAIQEHYRFSIAHREGNDRPKLDWHAERIYKAARKDPELRKLFGLPVPLDQDSRDVICIFEDFNRWDRNSIPQLKEIDKLIESWKLDPKAKVLIDKFNASKLLSLLDDDTFDMIMSDANETPARKQTARSVLMLLV